MPQFILHRENQGKKLKDLPKDVGLEFDVRSDSCFSCGLKVAHDPWTLGENFEAWLKYSIERGFTGPLLVNTKEDGLESRVMSLFQRYKVSDFMFIDTAPPTLIHLAKAGHGKHLSVRFSKFEPLEACLALKGMVQNVWVDCFEGVPVEAAAVKKLSESFQTFLVSPELHTGNYDNLKDFVPLAKHAKGICTKSLEEWGKLIA